MRNLFLFLCLLSPLFTSAQVDKEQLALSVSKAESANTELLKAFIWKRYATTTVNGEVKANTTIEFSFDETGKVVATVVSAESSATNKPGLRGRIQDNAAEDALAYVEKALQLSSGYTYMTKGELLDFFDKATLTEKPGMFELTGENILVAGDKLTVVVDAESHLFISKTFSSSIDKDPVSGEVKYETFSSGVSHCAGTILNLPAKKAVITATNKDYSKRVE